MEEDRGHMTERILTLTLDIISLLTGEIFTVVKSGRLFSIVAPQHEFMLPERTDNKKLLEFTNQVMELLTGEIEAGDLSHLNITIKEEIEEESEDGGEESGSFEDHKELYKEAMMEEPAERRSCPLYSLKGDLEIPQHFERHSQDSVQDVWQTPPPDQGLDFFSIKSDNKGEEERRHSRRSAEETTVQQEATSAAADPELQFVDETLQTSSPEFKADAHDATRDRPEVGATSRRLETARGPPAPLQRHPLPNYFIGERGQRIYVCQDCGKYFASRINRNNHRRIHKRPYSCSECGATFRQKKQLLCHRVSGACRPLFLCSEGVGGEGELAQHQRYYFRRQEDQQDVTRIPITRVRGEEEEPSVSGGQQRIENSGMTTKRDNLSAVSVPEPVQKVVEAPHRRPAWSLKCRMENAGMPRIWPTIDTASPAHLLGLHSADRSPHLPEKQKSIPGHAAAPKLPSGHHRTNRSPDPIIPEEPKSIPGDATAPKIPSGLYRTNRSPDPAIIKRPKFTPRDTAGSNIPSGHQATNRSPDPANSKRPPLPKFIIGDGGQKLFVCQDCGKCFTARITRNNHRRIHNNNRPFHCLECGKSYKQKNQLLKHQESHTPKPTFACFQCGLSFEDEKQLNGHRKYHHRGQGAQVGRTKYGRITGHLPSYMDPRQ